MTDKVKSISKEDLDQYVEALKQVQNLKNLAEKAEKEARIGDLEVRNYVLGLYIKYSIQPQCSIDIKTGEIVWPEKKEEAEKVVPEKKEDTE